MQKVAISEVTAGMVVGQSVEDSFGRVILKPGDVIQENFLPLLKKRGVRHLFVRAESPLEPEGVDAGDVIRLTEEEIRRLDRDLDERFTGHEGSPHMQLLKRVTRKHLIERAQQQRATSS